MEGRERLTLTPCPSFRELEVDGDDDGAVHHESPPRISAVHRPDEEEAAEERRIGEGGDSSDDDDSEFSFVLRGPETDPGSTADEIFSGGPVYPVFGRQLLAADPAAAPPPPPPRRSPLRKLLSEERSASSASSSSSVGDELDGIPPETYCVWAPAPAPARCRKSGSTGSLMRWRVLSDLVVGRSHSDGREKFVFLEAKEENKKKKKPPIPIPNPNPNPSRGKEEKEEEEERRAEGKGKKSEGGKVTARRVYYGKGSNSSGGRRSFLPYKQDLLGFFAIVNGK